MCRAQKVWVIFLLLGACSSFQYHQERGPASVHSIDIESLVNRLKPFSAYGCDTFYKKIPYPQEDKWRLCCVQHNAAYWRGGVSQDRHAADQRLQSCMTEIGEANTAGLIIKNKRAVQGLSDDSSVPWGYGWVLKRGYSPFSESEQKQVDALEKQIPEDLSTIEIHSKKKTLALESLTGNICLDGSLEFIQNTLARKFTPLSVQESHTIHSRTSTDYTVTIMTRECHLPYVFTYRLKNRDSCKYTRSKRLPLKDVVLSHVDYPSECH